MTLSVTAFTGWLMGDSTCLADLSTMLRLITPAVAEGDGSRGGDKMGWGVLEEVHVVMANLMVQLIVLHVAGVIVASGHHHEHLPCTMIISHKSAPEEPRPAIESAGALSI